jgi:hypothetical protein
MVEKSAYSLKELDALSMEGTINSDPPLGPHLTSALLSAAKILRSRRDRQNKFYELVCRYIPRTDLPIHSVH